MSLTKVSYSMIEGSPLNVLDFGADPTGSNDSSAAIQSALDIGGNIYFPEGTYLITTSNCLVVNSNTRLSGVRGASIIKVSSACYTGSQATQIKAIFSTDLAPVGYAPGYSTQYKWNASATTKTNIIFDELTFDVNFAGGGVTADTTYFNAIHLENATHCQIKNCDFIGTTNDNGYQIVNVTNCDYTVIENNYFNWTSGIQSNICTNLIISKNRLDNSVGTGIENNSGSFITIVDNYVQSPVWIVSALSCNSANSNISGNTVTGNSAGGLTGITLGHSGNDYYGNPLSADLTVCTNNNVYNLYAATGILLQEGQEVIISNNIISDCDPTGSTVSGISDLTTGGISIQGGDFVTIAENTISSCTRGILWRVAGTVNIQNNTILDITGTVDGAHYQYWAAIHLLASSDYITCSGNVIKNCNYGIFGATNATSLNIIGNNIRTTVYQGIYAGVGTTCNVLNNYLTDCGQTGTGTPYYTLYNTDNLNISGNVAYAASHVVTYAFQITKDSSVPTPTELMCYGNFNIGNTNDLQVSAGYGSVTLRGGV